MRVPFLGFGRGGSGCDEEDEDMLVNVDLAADKTQQHCIGETNHFGLRIRLNGARDDLAPGKREPRQSQGQDQEEHDAANLGSGLKFIT